MPLIRRLLACLAVCLALAAPAAATDGSAPVEGVDYVRIADGRRLGADDGRIEVVEIFSYACGHCADLHPLIEPWQRALPDDVRFHYLPVVYMANDPLATAYFAAEQLGVLDTTHDATFDAMHRARRLPRNATTAELAWFYAQLGVDRERLDAAMASDETRQKLNDGRDFLLRSGAQGTPTLIINGRYRVQARSLHQLLRTAGQLIAAERQAGHLAPSP